MRRCRIELETTSCRLCEGVGERNPSLRRVIQGLEPRCGGLGTVEAVKNLLELLPYSHSASFTSPENKVCRSTEKMKRRIRILNRRFACGRPLSSERSEGDRNCSRLLKTLLKASVSCSETKKTDPSQEQSEPLRQNLSKRPCRRELCGGPEAISCSLETA